MDLYIWLDTSVRQDVKRKAGVEQMNKYRGSSGECEGAMSLQGG